MKKLFIPLSIILALLFIYFARPIFLGEVFLDGDALFQDYPIHNFYGTELHLKTTPYWIPQILAGFPGAFDIYGFFYPPNQLLYRLVDPITAHNWSILLHLFIAAICTYFLAITVGLKGISALMPPVVYIFSRYSLNWGRLSWNATVFFVLPAILLSLKMLSRKRYVFLIFGGIALGSGLLASHTERVLYTAVAGFCYALFAAFRLWQTKKSARALLPLMHYCFIVLIAVGIGAIQWMPTLELALLSSRAKGVAYETATTGGLLPWQMISSLFPHFQIPPFLGQGGALLYVGAIPLFLAVVAIIFCRSNKHAQFFMGLGLIALLLTIKYSPLFWLLHKLPGFNLFRGQEKWVHVVTFSLAMLSGFGLDFVIKTSKSNISYQKLLSVLGKCIIALVAIAGIISLILWLGREVILSWGGAYVDRNIYAQSTHFLPREYYHQVIDMYYSRIWNSLSLTRCPMFTAVFAIVCSYLLLYCFNKGRFSARLFQIGTLGLVALNLFLTSRDLQMTVSRATYGRIPPTAAFFHKAPSLFRYYSWLPRDSTFKFFASQAYGYQNNPHEEYELLIEMLAPNINMEYGLSTIDGYDNLMTKRQAKLLSLIGSERSTLPGLATEAIPDTEKRSILMNRLQILSMLNVKHLISAQEFSDSRLRLVFTRVITNSTWSKGVPIYIYENKQALPRAYLVAGTLTCSNEEEVFNHLLDKDFSPSKTVIIEEASKVVSLAGSSPLQNPTVSILSYEPERVLLETHPDQECFLVLSDTYLPGWTVRVNGEEKPVYRANYLVRAVRLSPGGQIVEFRYSPPTSYWYGRYISIITSIICGIAALMLWEKGRAL